MCGVAGIYRFDGCSADSALLRDMTNIIIHRGPDDEGYHVDQNVGLSNRRLSIIDLSRRGRQPMSNEDGTIWITYNGEIYNYQELRAKMSRRGHIFKSDTDTEVIIHSYEDYGIGCLHHLNGMFAFAIWDSKKKRLFLARDRFGVKPLYYFYDKEKLLFGSEIKSILCDQTVERRVNLRALHHFLSLNYVPVPYTLFNGILQLLPSQYLIIEEGTLSLGEYWDLRFDESGHKSVEYYEATLLDLLHKTVKGMLVSDVPFGVFLSGGLDSSTVTYFMSRIMKEPVRTFSIGFEEESYSELDYARLVAHNFRTEHYEQVVNPDHLEDLLPSLIWHAEEPLADASMIPAYYVSQLARRHVKMVLCGDGGDEIFAGYDTFPAHYAARLYKRIPRFIRNDIIAPVINRLPVSDRKISFDFKAKRFIRGAEFCPDKAHFYWRVMLDENQKQELYSDEIRKQLSGVDTFEQTFAQYFRKTNAQSAINRMLYVDTRFYLPSDMLVKVDRMSMANSLEVRVPFLDHNLAEFMAAVPPSLKLRYLVNKKYLLKRVMQDKLPRHILHRKKQGFNLPVGLWLKTRLKEYVLDVLAEHHVKQMGYFKPEYMNKLLCEHFSGKQDNGYQIWGLITFFLWWRLFINGAEFDGNN